MDEKVKLLILGVNEGVLWVEVRGLGVFNQRVNFKDLTFSD